ncbi:MAG: competence/damage-inducible protein A [Candidatus Zixiibacteriota bacterium]
MRAEIISIGDEILYGQIADTNSPFIAEKLTGEGIKVVFSTSVGDEISKIAEAFATAQPRVDVIIATGGLGPTSDDLTKKAVVKAFKRNLVFHEKLLKDIEKSFEKRGLSMPKINQNQALLPQGAKPLANKWGVAPGIFIEEGDTFFFALPGVPQEMKWMLENEVLPILRSKKSEAFVVHRKLRTTGIPESAIYEKIGGLIDPKGELKIAFLPSYLGVDIRLVVSLSNLVTANLKQKGEAEQTLVRLGQAKIEELEKKIREILGTYVYGTDDQTLEEIVGKLLLEKGKTIAVAESCTGGLIGAKFTNISGSSKYFERGVVTYSNRAKTELLGVPLDIIEKYGAVSEEVAIRMAEGVRELAKTDYGLSATGIAGPTGGTPEKPVGLTYIGFAHENDSFAYKFQFAADRNTNRERAAQAALNMVRLFLIE